MVKVIDSFSAKLIDVKRLVYRGSDINLKMLTDDKLLQLYNDVDSNVKAIASLAPCEITQEVSTAWEEDVSLVTRGMLSNVVTKCTEIPVGNKIVSYPFLCNVLSFSNPISLKLLNTTLFIGDLNCDFCYPHKFGTICLFSNSQSDAIFDIGYLRVVFSCGECLVTFGDEELCNVKPDSVGDFSSVSIIITFEQCDARIRCCISLSLDFTRTSSVFYILEPITNIHSNAKNWFTCAWENPLESVHTVPFELYFQVNRKLPIKIKP